MEFLIDLHTDADFEDVITDEPNKIRDYYIECFNVLGWRKEKIREKELIEFEYSELEKHSQGLTQEQKDNFSVSAVLSSSSVVSRVSASSINVSSTCTSDTLSIATPCSSA